MGKAKLKIEFIENRKRREGVQKRRMKGLIKKLNELMTLCGVDAGMIISIPDQPDVVIPPADPAEMRRLYRAKNTADRAKKTQESGAGTSHQLQDHPGSEMLPQQSQPRTTPIIPYFDFMNLQKTDERAKKTQESDAGTSDQFEDHSGCSPMPTVALSEMLPQQSQPGTTPIIPYFDFMNLQITEDHSGCSPTPPVALSGMLPQQSQPRTIPIIPYIDFMNPHKTEEPGKKTQESDAGT